MMDKFTYNTSGVCSRKIDIQIEDGRVASVQFTGGCAGNTQGIQALVKGMTVDEVIERLQGIRCGFKKTSCPDQLAKALSAYKEQQT